MPGSLSDFQNLVESGEGVYLGDDAVEGQWRKAVRALQALAVIFAHKVATGTEPNDILEGLILGFSPNRNEWRFKIDSGGNLLVQENTGSEGSPVWTTRNTFVAGSGFSATSDHGALGGLGDDDHPQYLLATGARNIAGNQRLDNGADASLELEIDAGSSAQQIAQVVLSDRGTKAWAIRKSATGTLIIRDLINNQDVVTLNAAAGADHIVINANGVGIKKAAGSGKALDVNGSVLATAVDTGSANEVTKAWGSTESIPSSSAGALTLDFSASNYFEVTLAENITSITINNTSIPGPRTIVFKQDGTGSRTLAGWPAGVKWAGDAAPVLPVGANDEKVVTILVKANGDLRGLFSDDITV